MGPSTAWCSVTWVMTCRPRATQASATPLMARLLASVAPLVKMISRGWAPRTAATCSRASFTASSAAQPYWCVRLPALPKCSVRYGSIAATTRGSQGVVAR